MEPLLILARNASPWTGPTGNNTYLLLGALPTLIDAGVGDAAHVGDIAAALNGAPLAQVLVTHGHVDHAAGIPALQARWPVVRIFAETFPDLIDAGDRRLRAIATPGHAPDHVCFLDGESRDVYCGDLARSNGTIVIPASRGGNLRQYLESLRRIRDLAPRRLLPAHGPVIDDPASLIDQYLAHRADREQQVIDVLRRGSATPAQLVREIYGTLAPGLELAAAETVLAHLIKLEEDDRAERRGDEWILK